MMDLPIPVSDRIKEYKNENNRYIFTTDRGMLRISVLSDGIINVAFTVNGQWSNPKPWILPLDSCIKCEVLEKDDEYIIGAGKVQVIVTKTDSSVSFVRNGKQIFCENSVYPRQFEEVSEYRIVNDNSVVSKEVSTADGIKKVITEANSVEGRKLYRTRLHFDFEEDEAVYGLGQAEEGNLNLRGTVRYLHQANRRIAVPVMMSAKGYGVFFPTGSAAMFSDINGCTYFQTESDEMMEYYFLGGENIDESISMFRTLTGKAEMLPRWAFGYLQSKERYESEDELIEIADEFRDRNIGIDSLILDWLTWDDNMWGQKSLDSSRFPTPLEMTEKLHDKNIKLMISIWPNMTAACDNHKEFAAKKLLYPGTEVYDALNSDARELYWKQVNEGLFKYGFDGWWCDSSEPFTPEWTKPVRPEPAKAYYDFIHEAAGVMPYDEINSYGFYHAQGIYEGQRGISDKRVMNLTRNGYPGSQRFGTVLWSGDIGASFDTLRRQVAEGLNMCASGIPYWTIDIGAFFVKRGAPWFWEGHYDDALNNDGYKELYVRWYQYGAFLPIFRSHGTDCPREPWRFGEIGDMFYDSIIAANELRYKLMPYIYTMAAKVWKDNGTMMRLLAFDYSDDKAVWDIKDQYMFGDSLMICPVLEEMYYNEQSQSINKDKMITVYLPKGNDWYDIRDNRRYSGGQTVEVNADILSIPVFVKAGSIIPMCASKIESTARLNEEEIILYIYGNEKASCEVYSDAGDGYEYMDGAYGITKVFHAENSKDIETEFTGDERFKIKIKSVVIYD